jgi:hypothetical protein
MENTSQVLRFAGDVNIERINVISANGLFQDITNQVLSIQIFEDLFSPFITGIIVIKDSLDLVNLFPFAGEETLELRINTPTLKNGNINSKFYIYKLTNRDMLGDRVVAYEIHFTSLDTVVDLNKSVSSTFSGKVSDIAKTLLTDKTVGLQVESSYKIEETSNKTKYVSNFWSPVKNLYYIADTAVNKNGSPSYVFFQNRDGYNFVSLETLGQEPVLQNFVYDNYIRDERPGSGNIKNIDEDYKRINTITIPTAFDYISRVRESMYGSKQYTYDLSTKRVGSTVFDVINNYSKRKHLNEFSIASEKATYRYNSNVSWQPKYYSNFSGYGDATNTSTIQERRSVLKQMESTKLEIVVPGRMDYTVGRKVNLKLNKIQPISKTDKDIEDNMFSGNYIVSAINHYIDRERHECTMELMKDSLQLNLDRKK